ncbi:MAG: hypothetical protein Q7I93_00690, partial [Syntrophales bacterium]|nr:hypothetical protein [Syntrophales bacterium]
FLGPLIKCGLLVADDRPYFDTHHPAWAERLTEFYTAYLSGEAGDIDALELFAFPPEAAAGFYAFLEAVKTRSIEEVSYFKGQLAGPLTIGFQIKDADGRLAYYDEQLRDLLVKTLALHARWQAKTLAELGRPVIIFVDEPAVSVYGQSFFITVTKEMIKEDINAIFEAIHINGSLAGVHSCAAMDWTILYESMVDIVNPDVYNFGKSLLPFARETGEFLERGGVMSWGIVPTDEVAFEESIESLLQKLGELWDELARHGVSRSLLHRQALVTPACGAGLLSFDLAERIYHLTKEISIRISAGEKPGGER